MKFILNINLIYVSVTDIKNNKLKKKIPLYKIFIFNKNKIQKL